MTGKSGHVISKTSLGESKKVGGKTHRNCENLLNLLFDTIEFSNNNLNDFFLAFLFRSPVK